LRKVHNEELCDLCSSPYIIQVIESRRVRWIGHVAHTGGKIEMHMRFWWGNLMKREHLEDMGIDGRVIWKWSLEREDGRIWPELILLGIGTSVWLL
jgi:hypothetical protein